MKQATIHVMTGLPGSGKTTYAERLVKTIARSRRDSSNGCAYFGLDAIRGHPKTQVWPRLEALPDWERICLNMQEMYLVSVIVQGATAVLDNTHLWPEQLDSLIDTVWETCDRYKGVAVPTFVVHDLTDIGLEECINRNARRSDWVHPEVIWELHHKHQEARATGWRLTAEWLDRSVRSDDTEWQEGGGDRTQSRGLSPDLVPAGRPRTAAGPPGRQGGRARNSLHGSAGQVLGVPQAAGLGDRHPQAAR
jgi:predicted kinase